MDKKQNVTNSFQVVLGVRNFGRMGQDVGRDHHLCYQLRADPDPQLRLQEGRRRVDW